MREEVVLRARVNGRRIEVFVVGKWRGVRYYGGKLAAPKGKHILADIERTIRINTGGYDYPHGGPGGLTYNPDKGRLAGKDIRFDWQDRIEP